MLAENPNSQIPYPESGFQDTEYGQIGQHEMHIRREEQWQ
jgi:hypothetical protein